MVKKAVSLGYEYIGISDHSKSATYANGLSEERVKKQQAEIDKLQKKYKTIRIFKGIESDILPDGSLDYPEKVLKNFDFIIGSVHSRFNMNEKEMTKRVVRAMENPHTTMIGHVTGRLLLGRAGYGIDCSTLFETSAKTGCLIELNANPHRLDLDWRVLKELKKRKLKTSINPDAHELEGYFDIRYGIGIARKGWLEHEDVLNTLNAAQMEVFLRKQSRKD
ncbi:MAG: PHP domain-containing protein [Candidatus Omnitrophica bacterium]|nr:PHP domain-containing protein [Candidatus Omnitrophota bacterium]